MQRPILYRDLRGRFTPPPPPRPPLWYRVAVQRGRQSMARGPWRGSREAAMQDAISKELASYDRSRREHYLAVPVVIESQASFDQPPD